jgi:hypothetical protein
MTQFGIFVRAFPATFPTVHFSNGREVENESVSMAICALPAGEHAADLDSEPLFPVRADDPPVIEVLSLDPTPPAIIASIPMPPVAEADSDTIPSRPRPRPFRRRLPKNADVAPRSLDSFYAPRPRPRTVPHRRCATIPDSPLIFVPEDSPEAIADPDVNPADPVPETIADPEPLSPSIVDSAVPPADPDPLPPSVADAIADPPLDPFRDPPAAPPPCVDDLPVAGSDQTVDAFVGAWLDDVIAPPGDPWECASVDSAIEHAIEELVTHAGPGSLPRRAGAVELVDTGTDPHEEGRRITEPPTARPPGPPRRLPRRVEPAVSDVATLTKKFLAGQPVTCNSPEMLAAAVWELEEQRDQAATEGLITESVKAQDAVDAARAQMMASIKRKTQQELQENISSRERDSREEYQQFMKDMKQREQAMEAKFEQQMVTLKERQEREDEEHDTLWKVEPKIRRFNRSSQKMRILRIQQRLLLAFRRYDEAEQVRRLAEDVLRADTVERHFQMNAQYQVSRALLEKKHDEEVDTFAKAWQTRRGEFTFLKETLARRFTHRFNNLRVETESARDPEKVWVRKHRFDGDQLVSLVGASHRRPIISKRIDATEFNTLALPPLPLNGVTRKIRTTANGRPTV